MPITPNDLGGDEGLARRVILRARDIAPCIDSLADESEEKKDAIAVLKAVAAEIPRPGSARVRTKSRNGTSVSYFDPSTWFSVDDAAALRSLCGVASPPSRPVGHFPADRPIGKVWPEGTYS